jgi:hypothetical protein
MANVLPVLMFKPQRVVLFTTPEEKHCADNLEKLFKSKKISVDRKDNLDAYDYIKFKEIVKNELAKESDDVWLNVTGGTKLMALAAYEAFAEKDNKIVYCDTFHKNIIFLFPEIKTEKLTAALSISDYLLSYGYTIKEYKSTDHIEPYFDLFDYLLADNLIEEFVQFYNKVRKRLTESVPKFVVHSNNRNFIFRKDYFEYRLEYGRNNKKCIVVDYTIFNSGQWLEYFTYFSLSSEIFQEKLCGVKIRSDKGVENEIDVMALKDYQLYSFSCKSGKSDNQFDLFQIETLRNITSGTFGKGIFVIANKTTDKFIKRAEELEIKIINIVSSPVIKL